MDKRNPIDRMVAVLAKFKNDNVFDQQEAQSAINQALMTKGLEYCGETKAIMKMLSQVRRGEEPTYEFPNKSAEYSQKTNGL